MNRFVPVETPGGTIWAEMEETEHIQGLVLVSAQEKVLNSFEEANNALKENARRLIANLCTLGPDEITVSFGITAGAEGGNTFFGLAKVNGEASYTVTMKWKAPESKTTIRQEKREVDQ